MKYKFDLSGDVANISISSALFGVTEDDGTEIEGIEDAKAGRLTDGPDLKLGANLAETIED